MIQVSVIIPTYNRKSALEKAIQSVLAQKDVSFEVIVVDDGSTDDTQNMLREKFPSVTSLHQNNRGPSSARNRGIEMARGEWLAFLDSDDEWLSGKLKAQLDFFDKHPDYKICQTEEIWIRNGKRVNAMKKHQKFGGWIFEKCLPLCVVSPSAVMIHRDIFSDIGLFDESYPACEDYELWLRIAAKYPIGLIEKPSIKKYGGHADQLSRKFAAMDLWRIRALQKTLQSGILKENQIPAAHAMLEEKIRIYNLGAGKRDKPLIDRSSDLSNIPVPGTSVQGLKTPAHRVPGEWSVVSPLFDTLPASEQSFFLSTLSDTALTFQERRELVVMARDFEMWGEAPVHERWNQVPGTREHARDIFLQIRNQYEALQKSAKDYSKTPVKPKRSPLKITTKNTDKKIYGDCPVASPETMCCNLKTIDAVENCAFGCSYCTIQTFYGDQAVFDTGLKEKLEAISINPDRFYHFGTGQSSDSLAWGNLNNNLEILCHWAGRHPNILLEFKTKSDNIAYFLENEIPPNVTISWSLNSQPVIDHEEHFTASLNRRLEAARQVAQRGIPVAFHFHPIIYYKNWQSDYSTLAQQVLHQFTPEQILFISLGSVTFIKPVMQAIRKRGEPTAILQMEMVKAPHHKWTYPAELKIEQFKMLYETFRPWHDQVFFYLCMEETKFWDAVFGWHYKTNSQFESEMGKACFKKIRVNTHQNT